MRRYGLTSRQIHQKCDQNGVEDTAERQKKTICHFPPHKADRVMEQSEFIVRNVFRHVSAPILHQPFGTYTRHKSRAQK